jgi:hypothetical protein
MFGRSSPRIFFHEGLDAFDGRAVVGIENRMNRGRHAAQELLRHQVTRTSCRQHGRDRDAGARGEGNEGSHGREPDAARNEQNAFPVGREAEADAERPDHRHRVACVQALKRARADALHVIEELDAVLFGPDAVDAHRPPQEGRLALVHRAGELEELSGHGAARKRRGARKPKVLVARVHPLVLDDLAAVSAYLHSRSLGSASEMTGT